MRYKINDLKISEIKVSHFNRNNGKSIHNVTNLFRLSFKIFSISVKIK